MALNTTSFTDMTPRAKAKRDLGDDTDLQLHPLADDPTSDATDTDDNGDAGDGLDTDIPEDRKIAASAPVAAPTPAPSGPRLVSKPMRTWTIK